MATPYCPPVLGGRKLRISECRAKLALVMPSKSNLDGVKQSPEGVYNLNKVTIYVTTLASCILSVFDRKPR